MSTLKLDALELSALLCSRVCHDVISPVGAIVNGLEVLEDDEDPEMREFALDLIRKSANQASARLQFARLAFGAAGSAGAMIDLGDAQTVARGMYQDEKVTLDWTTPRAFVPKNRAKLLLNLIVLAASAIPRGGSIAVTLEGDDAETSGFRLVATGISARIPPHAEALLAGAEGEPVDAHGVQTFYAGLIAREAGMNVALTIEGDSVTILATDP